jgi:mycothiol synthase
VPDLQQLIARARTADGQPPFSDQALVDLRTGERSLIEVPFGAAIVSHATVGPSEAEFVVDPDARGRGIGTTLLEKIVVDTLPLARTGELLVWAHGDHPAARALAASHGLVAVRELLQLRMAVPAAAPAVEPAQVVEPASVVEPVETRFAPFVVGSDEGAWVALNAQVFASHPEQGSVSRDDVVELESEPWFDAGDFIVARDGDRMIGYCWLKVEHGIGEIYVIGVDESHRGEGLGRKLMTAGFARLAGRGIRSAALYVDSDNEPAVALYRSLGFRTHSVDIQYRLSR